MIKGVLLDLSGTIYVGDEVLPRALEAVQRLRAENIPLRYLTNSSRSSRKDILHKLLEMGFAVSAEEILTAPMAIEAYLRAHKLSPLVACAPGDSRRVQRVLRCDSRRSDHMRCRGSVHL